MSFSLQTGRPAWARPDLFPQAPPDSWGYLDRAQGPVIVDHLTDLQEVLRRDSEEMVQLVWTPEHHYMQVPEAVPELADAWLESRKESSARQLKRQQGQLRLGWLLFMAFMLYTSWELVRYRGMFSLPLLWHDLMDLSAPAMGFLLLLMFFLMPWYEAKKRWREVRSWTAENRQDAADMACFEAWLSWQKIFATKLLMGIIAVAGAGQVLSGNPFAAALIRGGEERWRLLTAPLLHGNLLHFMMNALGLMYLGRRVEALARWPHVAMVFLFSAWLGGECSVLMRQGASLGASGGLMGLLGFLLVFETRHARLVPRTSRRRLMAALIGTALIGLIGVKFIDNAAHAGGVLAGMLYAFLVFPRSESVARPKLSTTDRVMAIGCYAVLLYGLNLALQAMWA
jgi:membrane associated rhomboid family serine protease